MTGRYSQAFAQNLSELLKLHKMTQAELSRALNIPQQTISRYVTGKREISLEYLCRIADFFEEDIDVLIGRREF